MTYQRAARKSGLAIPVSSLGDDGRVDAPCADGGDGCVRRRALRVDRARPAPGGRALGGRARGAPRAPPPRAARRGGAAAAAWAAPAPTPGRRGRRASGGPPPP